MTIASHRRSVLAALGLTLALAAPLSAQAQPGPAAPGGPGWMMGPGMGPGMMRGPGMWGGRFGGPCNPRMAGFGEWRIDQIELAVKPTDAQRGALDELRKVSNKAAEDLAAACPKDLPKTSSERFGFMEKRMEAMLAAIKAVRPAFDAFYAGLTDEQKARLDAAGPGNRGWGWHRWRWSER